MLISPTASVLTPDGQDCIICQRDVYLRTKNRQPNLCDPLSGICCSKSNIETPTSGEQY
jgi:hypothetical protein